MELPSFAFTPHCNYWTSPACYLLDVTVLPNPSEDSESWLIVICCRQVDAVKPADLFQLPGWMVPGHVAYSGLPAIEIDQDNLTRIRGTHIVCMVYRVSASSGTDNCGTFLLVHPHPHCIFQALAISYFSVFEPNSKLPAVVRLE